MLRSEASRLTIPQRGGCRSATVRRDRCKVPASVSELDPTYRGLSGMGLTEVGADDRGLWDRVRHDDSAAFAVLYGRHVDAVYNYCFRRTGSWATAEDLTSVVFLETWRRREHIDLLNHSMLPFLLGTASNVVYKQTRSLIRHRRAVARLPRTVEPEPREPGRRLGRRRSADARRPCRRELAVTGGAGRHRAVHLAGRQLRRRSHRPACSRRDRPVSPRASPCPPAGNPRSRARNPTK